MVLTQRATRSKTLPGRKLIGKQVMLDLKKLCEDGPKNSLYDKILKNGWNQMWFITSACTIPGTSMWQFDISGKYSEKLKHETFMSDFEKDGDCYSLHSDDEEEEEEKEEYNIQADSSHIVWIPNVNQKFFYAPSELGLIIRQEYPYRKENTWDTMLYGWNRYNCDIPVDPYDIGEWNHLKGINEMKVTEIYNLIGKNVNIRGYMLKDIGIGLETLSLDIITHSNLCNDWQIVQAYTKKYSPIWDFKIEKEINGTKYQLYPELDEIICYIPSYHGEVFVDFDTLRWN